MAIELKMRRDEETDEEGLAQLAGYLGRLGEKDGWLVLFDLRKEVGWKEKIFTRTVERDGLSMHVIGC